MILRKCIFCHCSIQNMLVFVDCLSLPSFAIRTNIKNLFVFRDPISSPHHHLTKAHVASFSPLLDLKMFFSLVWKKGSVTCRFNHTKSLVVFQSSAAALGSSPAAVGRCNVSQCPGSATAGQHARTRVTRWTVPVSIAHLSPFTPTLLPNTPNTYNTIGFWKE